MVGQVHSKALIPLWLEFTGSSRSKDLGVVILGSVYVAALAQVAFPLPFTPVPITGQTFGVATLALLWGSRRATSAFALYLVEGLFGLPVFALGANGATLGPTFGYLLGMLLACFIVGRLSDLGLARTPRSAFFCCLAGSSCIFILGLVGLLFFIPSKDVIELGLLPFLPGDLLKNSFAALLVSRLSRSLPAK